MPTFQIRIYPPSYTYYICAPDIATAKLQAEKYLTRGVEGEDSDDSHTEVIAQYH